MSAYYLAAYRQRAPFEEDVVRDVLRLLARHVPTFFPASFITSRSDTLTIETPDDFDRSTVPEEFRVGPQAWRISIDGSDQSELSVVDDRAPGLSPASVVIRWPAGALPPVEVLEALLIDVCAGLKPERALITDDDTPVRSDVYDRSFEIDQSRVPSALTWFTWLGPQQREAMDAARKHLGHHARDAAGGLLLRLTDRPTEDEDWWLQQRRAAEGAMDLEALHRRFPRPGH